MEIHYQELILSKILDNINSGIIFVDARGKIIIFNRAASDIFSVDSKDVINEHYSQFLLRFESEEFQNLIQSMKGKEFSPIKREAKAIINDTHKTLSVYLTNISDFQKSFCSLIIVEDVTENARSEIELMRQDVVIPIARHLHDPLVPIRLSIERMKKKWEQRANNFDHIFQQSSRIILNQVAYLNKLTEELLKIIELPLKKK